MPFVFTITGCDRPAIRRHAPQWASDPAALSERAARSHATGSDRAHVYNVEAVSIEDDHLRFNLNMNLENHFSCWTNYVLEASQDLKVWQPPLLTNPPPSFTLPYDSTTDGNRFFRLRTVQ